MVFETKDQGANPCRGTMTIKGPKFVRRANMWCVTIFLGKTQTQNWFTTEQEAKDFIESKKED